MSFHRSLPAAAAVAVLTVLTLTACGSGSTSTAGAAADQSDPAAIAIDATDTTCAVAQTSLPAGRHTFQVTNNAAQVNEVYVYAPGDQIMGEVENIGPSTQRTLVVDLAGGDYEIACKPGMVGDGIRTALTVTGAAAPSVSTDGNLQNAVTAYRLFVQTEAQALTDSTSVFTRAVLAGDLVAAKTAYGQARLHYERIEPTAESFGELDPLIDMRVDDATDGAPFVGFHALEQLLFEQHTLAGAAPLATELDSNVAQLTELVKTVEITPLTMSNGAKSLLDEVAKSKVTGEEERYSRIDLLDFSGNVDGARSVYSALRPALSSKDSDLVATLDQRFAALVDLLATHQAAPGDPGYVTGSPYVSYDSLTAEDVKALAVAVDAVSEPVGQISGVVTAP